MTDKPQERLNLRGETQAQAREVLVNALKANTSWMTGYAEAYLDDFLEMAGAPIKCQVCQLPQAVEGIAGDPTRHCACARLLIGPEAGQTPGAEAGIFCPACEQFGAVEVRYTSTVNPVSGDPSYTAHDLEGHRCPHCNETFIDMEQARRNEARYRLAREAAAGGTTAGDGGARDG